LSNYKKIRAGWFAYATNHLAEGSIGIYRGVQDACTSPIYTVFSCTQDVWPEYLFRLLKTPKLLNQYRTYEHASVDRRGAVRYRDFAQIEADIPPIAEQRRIAEILDMLDAAIRKTEQLIVKLKQMKQGALNDLLTCGIDKNGELRDPRRNPEQFKDSPLGKVPKNWELVALESVLEDIRYGTSSAATGGPKDVPILRIPNVESGELHFGELKYLRASTADLRRFDVRSGDVLVIRTNGNPSILGTCAHVAQDLGPCLFASYLIRLRLLGTHVYPRYVSTFLNSHLGRIYINRQVATSAGNYNINTSQLRRLPLLRPPLVEQEIILERLQSFDVKHEKESRYLSKLRLLKQGLMEDLLTGRVPVTPLLNEATP
jgi:type I restriction enzyme S subunit